MSVSLPRALSVLALALILVAAMSAAALAAPPPEGFGQTVADNAQGVGLADPEFGNHVSGIARPGGPHDLGTEHNPGMHQGIAGWHGGM